MNEVVRFSKAGQVLEVLAELVVSSGTAGDDGLLDRADAFRFRFRATNAVRSFLSSLDGLTAEATRTMPGRVLDVDAVTPQPDRRWMEVSAIG